MPNLLSRDNFRNGVFERDNHTCVWCGVPAVDAHHIIERRLFEDGGYYLDNGASLCSNCHIEAEKTNISAQDLRDKIGIKNIILPRGYYRSNKYDKWGNVILSDGRRVRGELFDDGSVQKILKDVLDQFTPYVNNLNITKKMKNTLKTLLILTPILLMLGGCGSRVEVPPAHIGKVLTKEGFQDGIIQPSSLRLPWDRIYPPKLTLVETSDNPIEEKKMQVFIPQDKLNLTVDIRGVYTISSKEENVNKIFDKVKLKEEGGRIMSVSAPQVYKIYAEQVIRASARTVLTQYDITHIMENRESISNELFENIQTKLKDSPISISRMEFADIQPPQVIVSAQEKAKEREIEIQKAEADKQISLARAEADLEVARKQQEVDLLEAETQVLVNKKLAEGVTEAFVTQRGLKILEAMVRADNKVFFMPQEAFKDPAVMIPTLSDAYINKGDQPNTNPVVK
jgi:regulator of protease activity HflC (stomatin/prohibitin superfamily)